jgi:hypothetical protein
LPGISVIIKGSKSPDFSSCDQSLWTFAISQRIYAITKFEKKKSVRTVDNFNQFLYCVGIYKILYADGIDQGCIEIISV